MEKFENEELHVYFLVLLIVTDIMFILLHLVGRFGPTLLTHIPIFGRFGPTLLVNNPIDIAYSLQIDVEFGFAEFFQYIKTFWIVLFFGALWYKLRQPIYIVWGLFFAYFLIDDAFLFHEYARIVLSKNMLIFGAYAEDVGEVLFFALVGIILLTSIFIVYRFNDEQAKMASKNIGVLIGLLVFFGFFWDAVNAAVQFSHGGTIVTLIEDGGEMLAISLICWYALNLFKHLNHMESLNFIEQFKSSTLLTKRFKILKG